MNRGPFISAIGRYYCPNHFPEGSSIPRLSDDINSFEINNSTVYNLRKRQRIH